MNILLVNATMKKGSTYHISKILIDFLKGEKEVQEVFLPEGMPDFCTGCGACFMLGEERCPHHKAAGVFLEKLLWADLLIFSNPVYVFHTTGQMKALLDHYGYMWMVHRPNEKMFRKMAVVISTAAGAGMRSANKDIRDSLTFWGVGNVWTYGKAVYAVSWNGVKEGLKKKIRKDMGELAVKIEKKRGKVRPAFKTILLFHMMKLMHKKLNNPIDLKYWMEKGWIKD